MMQPCQPTPVAFTARRQVSAADLQPGPRGAGRAAVRRVTCADSDALDGGHGAGRSSQLLGTGWCFKMWLTCDERVINMWLTNGSQMIDV